MRIWVHLHGEQRHGDGWYSTSVEGSGEGRGQQAADGGELVDPAGHGDGLGGAAEVVQAVVVLHVVRLGRHEGRGGGEMGM